MLIFVEPYDQDGKPIPLPRGPDGKLSALPNEVATLFICHDRHGPIGEHVECRELATVLQRRSTKLPHIEFAWEDGEEEKDPELYEMLFAAIPATDNFWAYEEADCLDDVFCHCLMHGLMVPNGPKTLKLGYQYRITLSNRQAGLFFHGLAHSSCLESLNIDYLGFEDPLLATSAFVNALQQNRSLKDIWFEPQYFQDSEAIFRAAIQDAKVGSITTWYGEVDLGVTLDSLSFEACQLRSLCCSKTDFSGVLHGPPPPTTINTSVHTVEFSSARLQDSHLTCICSVFQSLTSLDLSKNHFQDLSPLYPLLVGDDRTLQDLSLACCGIKRTAIKKFFRLVPHMNYIRHLKLEDNPFLESRGWMKVLKEGMQSNNSLEMVWLHDWRREGKREPFHSKLNVALAVNRAWRRYMENGLCNGEDAFNLNLWPLVLERATKMHVWCSHSAICSNRHLADLQRSALFWLLRERMDWPRLVSTPSSTAN